MSTNEFEITFVIPPLSGADDPRIDKVDGRMDIVVSHSLLTLATVTAEDVDAVAAALGAAAVLAECGLQPTRTCPDLVTLQDIADRADLPRESVVNWVHGDQESDPFPAPANLGGGGVWLWGDVASWLRRHDYETDEIGFPTLADHVHIDSALLSVNTSQ